MSVSVLPDASGSGSWIADYGTASPPLVSDMATLWSSLDTVLAAELHGAHLAMGCTPQELLLAALGRTVARTIGDGMLIVDVHRDPGHAGVRRVGVACVSRRGLSGPELLAAARPGAGGSESARADMGFAYGEGVGLGDSGHPLAVHIRRDTDATLLLHWRFDTRSFDHCTVQELAEQFPLALIEVTSG